MTKQDTKKIAEAVREILDENRAKMTPEDIMNATISPQIQGKITKEETGLLMSAAKIEERATNDLTVEQVIAKVETDERFQTLNFYFNNPIRKIDYGSTKTPMTDESDQHKKIDKVYGILCWGTLGHCCGTSKGCIKQALVRKCLGITDEEFDAAQKEHGYKMAEAAIGKRN
jgi:hypothetical protein